MDGTTMQVRKGIVLQATCIWNAVLTMCHFIEADQIRFKISRVQCFLLLLLFGILTTQSQPVDCVLTVDFSHNQTPPANISLVSEYFPNQTLTRITLDQNRTHNIYVGGVNILILIESSNAGTQHHSLQFKKSIRFRPYASNESMMMCRYDNDDNRESQNNVIQQLFIFKNTIFACGTQQCGICNAVRSDFSQTKALGNLVPNNMVASRRSSLVFFGHKNNVETLYVAHEYDGRDVAHVPPYISTRLFTDQGLVYSINDANYKSFLKLHHKILETDKLRSKFIYGFSHNGFAYFISVQQMTLKSDTFETKLARVCESDPTSFYSYIEIPLECRHDEHLFTIGRTATLDSKLWKSWKDNVYNKHSLYVAFEMESNSSVCAYDMNTVEEYFFKMALDCSTIHFKTELQEKFFGEKRYCKEVNNVNNVVCGTNTVNRYINAKDPLQGNLTVFVQNDVITSLTVNQIFPESNGKSSKIKKFLFFGTASSRIVKIDLNKNTTLFTHELPHQYGSLLPDPVLDQANLLFYMASEHGIVSVPIDSCFIYKTCASCFRSVENCFWDNDQCYERNDTNRRREYICAPIVLDFMPKSGPVDGGTVLTFTGLNFGEPSDSKFNSDLSITVGDINCRVLKRSDSNVSCTLDSTLNKNVTEGIIKFQALDLMNFPKRRFRINGTVTLKEKFLFKVPKLKGIHPSYGPFIGGTIVMIYGEYLSVGTNTEVILDSTRCDVLIKSDNYILCKSQNFKEPKIQSVPTSVILVIDKFRSEINRNNEFTVDSIKKIVSPDDINVDDDLKQIIRYSRSTEEKTKKIGLVFLKQLFENPSTPLIFNECFQFKPNPLINFVKQLEGIMSGNTTIDFYGEYLDSVHYPRLEIIFEAKYSKIETLTSVNVPCNRAKNNSSILSCALPSLRNHSLILNDHLTASFILSMDGFVLESFRPPDYFKNGTTNIVFYSDPQFDLFKDEHAFISTSDRILKITGKNLYSFLPYRILVDDSYLCSPKKHSSNLDQLWCEVIISEEQLESIIGSHFNLSVQIGTLNIRLGVVEFFTDSASLSILNIMIIVLVFTCFVSLLIYVSFSHLIKKRITEYQAVAFNANGTELVTIDSPKSLESFINYVYDDQVLYQSLFERNLIIAEDRIRKINIANSGNFGIVYRGTLDNVQEIAIKSSKAQDQENNSMMSQKDMYRLLFQEADVMKDFNHVNVLPLIGVALFNCSPVIIMPFMQNGDLLKYLRNPNNDPTYKQIIEFAIQIAKGMQYLTSLKFVHRDLAARNCMIDSNLVIKVADFGLSRKFLGQKSYYHMNNMKISVPTRWMAIESLKQFVYTAKTDVWSFGVVMWELLTRGQTPYKGIGHGINELLNYLESGNRLPRPLICHELIFNIALKCWTKEPNNRPTFEQLVTELQNVLYLFQVKQVTVIEQNIEPEMQEFSSYKVDFCSPDVDNILRNDYERMYNCLMNEQNTDSGFAESSLMSNINSGPMFKSGLEEMDSIMNDSDQSIEPPPYTEATAQDYPYDHPSTSGYTKAPHVNGNSTSAIVCNGIDEDGADYSQFSSYDTLPR